MDRSDKMKIGSPVQQSTATRLQELQVLDTVESAGTLVRPVSVDTVLAERAQTHGKFLTHADLSQRLAATMRSAPSWSSLPPDMREALEMVQHKIARVLNGQPDHLDNWVDICGYAQLVADRLQGVAR